MAFAVVLLHVAALAVALGLAVAVEKMRRHFGYMTPLAWTYAVVSVLFGVPVLARVWLLLVLG